MHYTPRSIKDQKKYPSIKSIISDLTQVLVPPERINVSESAVKYRVVHNPPAYSGPWSNEVAPYLPEVMDTLESREYSAVCVVAPAQSLKALALDTKIPTPTGWTTMGELQPGDMVFDENGVPCQVLVVTEPMLGKQCFKITFDDGTTIVTDHEHKWFVGDKEGWSGIKTTGQMSENFNVKTARKNGRSRYAVTNQKPLVLPPVELPIDPYVLGVWLGNGSSYRAHITCGYDDVDHYVREIATCGYPVKTVAEKSGVQIYVNPMLAGGQSLGVDQEESLGVVLKHLGLYANKHIPEKYLRGSFEQRLALLQGLMDTDGTSGKKCSRASFCTTTEKLMVGVRELLWSLGIKHTMKTFIPKGGKRAWTLDFTCYPDQLPVFRLQRKLIKMIPKTKTRPGQVNRRWIRNIEPVDSVPVKCIAVTSKSHLYLAGEQMVPTHNTECILNWATYSVVCDPSDFMVVEKSQQEARNFSLMKLDRMIRHSPEVNSRMIHRRSADNTFDKRFKSGAFLTLVWPTVNALSGKTIRRVALTDYDRMDQDVGGEGSPFDLARRRTNTYKRLGMTYVESSPSFDVLDPRWTPQSLHAAPPVEAGILNIYNRGDRRRWYWKCPHCREWFEPCFSLMRWPDSNDPMECAEQCYMACPHCFTRNGAMILPHEKHELNLTGRWVLDGQRLDANDVLHGKPMRSDIASFWIKGPATAFGVWKTLVINYLLAMREYEQTGNDRPLKTTVNTDQGAPYMPPSMRDVRTPEDIMSRAEPLGEKVVPHGVRFLVATIDVQKSRFVVQVHGVKPAVNTVDIVVVDRFDIQKSERYDEDGERYFVNPASYGEDWDLITSRVIERTYPLSDGSGRHMSIRLVCCDSGGRAGVTTRAYEYYRRLRTQGHSGRFFLVKGEPKKSAPRVQKSYPDSDRKDRAAGARGEIPVLMLNTNILKDWVDSALGRTEPGAGYIQFPDWLNIEFYKELCAETRNLKGEWQNPNRFRNESWDLLTYCYAACVFLRAEKIDWDSPQMSWAAEWDDNPLVVIPEKGGQSLVKPKQRNDDLASQLKALAQQVG